MNNDEWITPLGIIEEGDGGDPKPDISAAGTLPFSLEVDR